MYRPTDIKNILKLGLLALVLSVSVVFSLPAKEIVCGKFKCDIETRKCIKTTGLGECIEYKQTLEGSLFCAQYRGFEYKCVGKNEDVKGSTEVASSVSPDGTTLSGDAERKALNKSKTAEFTKQEKEENAKNYYSDKEQLQVSDDVNEILKKLTNKNNSYYLRQALSDLANYTSIEGYDKGRGGIGDSRIKDAADTALKYLRKFKEKGYINQEEFNIIKAEIDRLSTEAYSRAEGASETNQEEGEAEQMAEERQATAEEMNGKCASASQLRARYNSGCWSCLVLERLISAFLRAAKQGIPVTQKAGVALLVIGMGIWLVFWGLKNVSSFTQLQLGNILNDLLKFMFKCAIAYIFIMYGLHAISQYFIRPIMSVGALVGQQFWADEVSEYVENYTEAFEPDDPQRSAEIAKKVEENNKGDKADGETPENPEANSTGVVEEPQEVEPSNIEDLVQDLQKAFMAILNRQLGEIKNSCGGPCGDGCRHKSCTNTGHQEYIKSIMREAGYGSSVDHYCQASITAAMNKLTKEIGGDVTTVLKGASASCLNGIALGAVGDVLICKDGKQVYNNINVGDTVYYHDVRSKNSGNISVGGGSGHHAVTYAGGGQSISFNGDSKGTLCNSYYYNVYGKVLCVSCLLRKKLEENPALANGIDKQRLAQLANGSDYANQSLVNYQGGVFTNAGGGSSSDFDAMIPTIPDITYTGPTDIVPKSIMNSILGAMRVITKTVSENMVFGNMIMCYSTIKNGGAWNIEPLGLHLLTLPNIFMWIQGAVVFCLGLMLVMAIAYYFIDISFKLGFAVLALPLVMGLWPFSLTQDKLFATISTIAKAAACFAFMAITTAFGMALVSESVGGLDNIYVKMDTLDSAFDNGLSADEIDKLKNEIAEVMQISSMIFIMMLFSIIYFYKLVQKTCSDLVNKFFPDKTFGDASPMHSGATMATSMAVRPLQKVASWVGDTAAHQTGKLAQKTISGTTKTLVHFVAHPVRGTRTVGNKAKAAYEKIRGKNKEKTNEKDTNNTKQKTPETTTVGGSSGSNNTTSTVGGNNEADNTTATIGGDNNTPETSTVDESNKEE